MTFQSAHTIMPYLLLADLGAALFGSSAASAGERITLEVIGAVRMAGAEEIRPSDRPPRLTENRQAQDAGAERADAVMSSHRN
ncbi:hypothetical protein ABEV34_17990 [Methylorubrum rhodesianum]|uniref:hypothetical protein n=1 Tax=Methylorubrum rhodesianum TaxID=29427 RepID=UPI00161CA64C|nr:hypothetical protein [Methylorubrum rhodesianum]MBB5764770.1 hypothetical protein [Methylorubrum rhodesianum]